MDNMRGFTVAIYPETRKELEIIKNKNNFTWDELFNYLMEVEKSKKQKQEVQKGSTTNDKRNKRIDYLFISRWTNGLAIYVLDVSTTHSILGGKK